MDAETRIKSLFALLGLDARQNTIQQACALIGINPSNFVYGQANISKYGRVSNFRRGYEDGASKKVSWTETFGNIQYWIGAVFGFQSASQAKENHHG